MLPPPPPIPLGQWGSVPREGQHFSFPCPSLQSVSMWGGGCWEGGSAALLLQHEGPPSAPHPPLHFIAQHTAGGGSLGALLGWDMGYPCPPPTPPCAFPLSAGRWGSHGEPPFPPMLQHHPGFVSAAPQLHFNLFLVVECLCSYVGPEPTLGLHYGSHLKKEINVFLLLLFIIDWLLVFCPTAPPRVQLHSPTPPPCCDTGLGVSVQQHPVLISTQQPLGAADKCLGGHRAAAHLLQCCGCRGSPGSWEGCVLLGCHAGVMGGSNGDP